MGTSCPALFLLDAVMERQSLSHGPGGRKAVTPLVSQPDSCSLPLSQPSGQPSLLLQYRESGLSSSSYELSQYIRDGADQYSPVLTGPWSPVQAGEV